MSLLFKTLFTVLIFLGMMTDPAAARLIDRADKDNIMVVFVAKKGAEDYLEYAETTLKERLRSSGFRFMNQEMTEKVKKDRLLMQAIKNASASAMAKINSDYGAGILIRGTLLSVRSDERISNNWEGRAALSIVAIDTKTGEEIEAFSSDPMGTTGNPAPMEESSLSSKQMAIKSALDNLMQKLGGGSDLLTSSVSLNVRLSTAFKHSVGEVNALLFSPDSHTLFIGGEEGVEFWEEGSSAAKILSHDISGKVNALALNRSGKLLAVATTKGHIQFFELPGCKKTLDYDAHSSGSWALDFSPDGKILVSGGGDGVIRLWHAGSSIRLGEIQGHSEKETSLVFDLQGKNIMSVSEDLNIKMWDLNTRKEVRSFTENMDRLTTSAFSADRALVAYAAKTVDFDLAKGKRIDKRFIRVRDALTGRDLVTFEGHSKDINSLSFILGKRFLISSGEDRQVKVWDIEKKSEIVNLEQTSKYSRIAASKDGRLFVTADNENISIWTTR